MKNMKGFCDKCPDKKTCVELCPECEEWVSQDYVSQTSDMIYKNIQNSDKQTEWGSVDLDNSTKLIKTIICLYLEGKSTRNIAYHLSCSQQYIAKMIKKYKKGDNQILKKLQ